MNHESNIPDTTKEEAAELGGDGKYAAVTAAFEYMLVAQKEGDGSTLSMLDKQLTMLRFIRELKKFL